VGDFLKKWIKINYDAKRQGQVRCCGPGPHVHFRAVSHVTGILGIFQNNLLFLASQAKFSTKLLEILHEVS